MRSAPAAQRPLVIPPDVGPAGMWVLALALAFAISTSSDGDVLRFVFAAIAVAFSSLTIIALRREQLVSQQRHQEVIDLLRQVAERKPQENPYGYQV